MGCQKEIAAEIIDREGDYPFRRLTTLRPVRRAISIAEKTGLSRLHKPRTAKTVKVFLRIILHDSAPTDFLSLKPKKR
jgi:hypothetical protein